jgi:nucleoside-diphosphate-sugar epimerase
VKRIPAAGRDSFAGALVLVTGGAGFIGSHLVDALVERGARVRVLDDFSTGSRENLAAVLSSIDLVAGDIRDASVCRRACEGAELVFHEAALGSVPRSVSDPATTVSVNVSGTANVFAAARDADVSRVVYASSSSVYGDSERLPKREGEEGRPLSPYALTKRVAEELAAVFASCYGMELVGLRYFNVYGPRQDPDGPYAAVIPRFFRACLAGEPPLVHGDGEQSRDFTYVADAVAANLLAAAAPPEACGRAYNVGGGARTTVTELARLVCGVAGSASLAPEYGPPRAGDVRHSLADGALAGRQLGYRPAWTVPRGLEAARDHYMSRVGSPAGAPAAGAHA